MVDSCGFSSETNCESMAYVSFQAEKYSALITQEHSHQRKNETELLEVRRVAPPTIVFSIFSRHLNARNCWSSFVFELM